MAESSQAGNYDFFCVSILGFEDLVAEELNRWCPDLKFEVVKGGVNFSAPLLKGFVLNRALKTPTRILLRLSDFGCRDFPKLFKKISGFPWEDWVPDDADLSFHASTHQSRLRIKKRIEETCKDARKARLKKRGIQAAAKGSQEFKCFSVYIRFVDDVCFVSLDTSGEILHKRGQRPLSSEAPLRESTAAALLMMLEADKPHQAPQEKDISLVDPMMGGGTFMIEALQSNQTLSSRQRLFAFEELKPWLNSESKPSLPESLPRSGYEGFVGFEKDPKIIRAAKENLKAILGSEKVRIIEADFMTAQPLPNGHKRWVITNPPYGERLKINEPLGAYYQKLLSAIEKVASPERALLIFPEKAKPRLLQLPKGWKIENERRFLNGGLPVVALRYGISR